MTESSNNTPLISVIMSVKNGESTLQRSIDSIKAQTLKNWEFIICDDGSTDNTFHILEQNARDDNRIQILHNEQSCGLAFSLNRCIEVAKSNILARQDADDSSQPNRFEIQYEFVMCHPEYAIVGTSWNNVDENGKKMSVIHPMKEPTALDQVKGGSYMHPSWMMRKDQIAKVGFYTANKYTMRNQDYHLVMKVLGERMRLYNMDEVLYNYTADDNMIKRTRDFKRVKGLMWIQWDSYKRNRLPIWCYVFVLKPLIVHLIPSFVMMRYHKKQFSAK